MPTLAYAWTHPVVMYANANRASRETRTLDYAATSTSARWWEPRPIAPTTDVHSTRFVRTFTAAIDVNASLVFTMFPTDVKVGLVGFEVVVFEIVWALIRTTTKTKTLLFLNKDTNECLNDGTTRCQSNAVCKNTLGSYRCVCRNGFVGNGVSCEGIILKT